MKSSSLCAFQWFCLVFLLAGLTKEASGLQVYNVLKYGARRDGMTDNSKVFMDVWKQACATPGGARVLVPAGNYNVNPVSFDGPCKGSMEFQMDGLLKAPSSTAVYRRFDYWIKFNRLDGFKLTGRGTFDGQGASAWRYNDCGTNKNCKLLPTSLQFNYVNNSNVLGIHSLDSKLFHITVFSCAHLTFEHITITAPENSPNTDGIHIGNSNNIKILHSKIGTGDDCVSLGAGSMDVEVMDVTCGPGHGISVGSLGKEPKQDTVIGLTVKNCTFIGTQNGVRIKTWADSYPGTVKNSTFQDIYMENVYNPIFIDQEYCPFSKCNKQAYSQVQVSGVICDNIRGTSATEVAVNLLCSKRVPCNKIMLKNINLSYQGNKQALASCVNALGVSSGIQVPPSCLPH